MTDPDFASDADSSPGSESETETNAGDDDDADDDADADDDDDWSKNFTTPNVTKVFSDDAGPFIYLPPDADEIAYFDQLFPETLWNLILTETKRYANDKNRADDNLSIAELKAFIGLVLAMGIHELPRFKNYWSHHWVLSVPQFAQVMTRERFWYLWSNLHLVNNANCVPATDPDHDRLFKVRPLMSKLQETFAEHYCPGQNIAVDESMVRFKGRCTMKQYMPLKPIKRGFKIWCAACSCCGYVVSFQMYTGREKNSTAEKGLAHRVVTDLVVPLLAHKNRTVYMDNFFTSLPLFTELEKNGTYACGTYRTNRSGFPKELTDKPMLKNLQRGDVVMRHKSGTTALVWMDKKPVYVVSNAHQPTISSINRKMSDGSVVRVSCPEIVCQYNQNMLGVDVSDQLKNCYGIDRKS